MSSSFPERGVKRRYWLGLFAGAAGVVGSAQAAQEYWVPSASVSAVHHSDILLTGADDPAVNGVLGNLQTILGVRTPTSTTEFRPRIEFENYSDRPELRHTNVYLDLNSRSATPRNVWELNGSYAREGSYSAQRTEAAYDNFDPNDPTVDATGHVAVTKETYTRIQLRPSYSHDFTERLGSNFGLFYQKVDFTGATVSSDSVDYQDATASGGLSYAVTPRTRVAGGVYGTRYRAEDDSNTTTGRGVNFSVEHNWTQRFTANADLFLERTKVDQVGVLQDTSTNSWALNFGVVRQGQTGNLRMNVGRFFSPSTGGSRITVDQLRVQYDRRFKPLWSYTVAMRGLRNREQGTSTGRADRNYASSELSLVRDLTPTWNVSGKVAYTWQKYLSSNISGHDSQAMLSVGYTGLGPR